LLVFPIGKSKRKRVPFDLRGHIDRGREGHASTVETLQSEMRDGMPRKLNRRELVKAAAGTSLVAAALGLAIALQAARNSNPASQVPSVDMSRECTVADPEHYHLEFENEYVRVIRCRIPGRDKVKMHNHPFGSVIIFMTDQNLHQTLENGTTEEAHNKAGHVLWGSGSQAAHMGENVTDRL
jgi:hypothetical protein